MKEEDTNNNDWEKDWKELITSYDFQDFNITKEEERQIFSFIKSHFIPKSELIKMIKKIPRANILDEFDTYYIDRKKLIQKIKESGER